MAVNGDDPLPPPTYALCDACGGSGAQTVALSRYAEAVVYDSHEDDTDAPRLVVYRVHVTPRWESLLTLIERRASTVPASTA